MKAFAELLDRLAYEPGRNAKLSLLQAYFRATPDPARGYALAAMTGSLVFAQAKSGLLRALIVQRVDPVLFALSYDFVGDLSETIALMWPGDAAVAVPPSLEQVVEALATTRKIDLPARIAAWLDGLDETGRWALLKLVTGALRIGVSARLAKTAVAEMGGFPADAVEEIWHGLGPPYAALFAWVEGRGTRPQTDDPAPFRPAMLAHALDEAEMAVLVAEDFCAEWKWDGIRVQAVVAGPVARLYSRTAEDISSAFPDLMAALAQAREDFCIDGELLVRRDGQVLAFGDLQQRLNRKTVSAKLMAQFPAHIRAYDLLGDAGADLRALGFIERRARLEALVARLANPRIDLSPLLAGMDWAGLAAARRDPASAGAGADAGAVEGLMLKRRDSPYVPGRPKGLWYKWKRDPFNIDAVLMYAQRGHGKRSSFYSDFTFGVWAGAELVPVGKAYFGFTDAELVLLDRFVRNNTVQSFGPVREVAHGPEAGLVLEVAFEGLNRSTRHKSGVAMRFPRIARIRWDKPVAEADGIGVLLQMLGGGAAPPTRLNEHNPPGGPAQATQG